MSDFNQAYKITMSHEGGYANNPADTGGETWKGVARKKNPNWGGWTIVDRLRKEPNFPANLSTSEELQSFVLNIYKKQYWDVNNLDLVKDQSIANEVFDTGVNMGTGTAGRFLQRAVNCLIKDSISVDGVIGKGTLAAVNGLGPNDTKLLYKILNTLQGNYYIELSERNATQKIFMRSWFSRVTF